MNVAQTQVAQKLQEASAGKPVFQKLGETQPVAPAETPKVETPKAEKTGRGRKPSAGPTKQSKAVEIYKRLKGEKNATIAAIRTELEMTEAGATTYFYNAKKIAQKG